MFKAKNNWFIILKWFLVLLLSGYIIYNVSGALNKSSYLSENIENQISKNLWLPFLVISLSFLNWFFEILKWQTLTENISKISFSEAMKQTLASHSTSLLTPFKSGDYAFKTLFFEKDYKMQIIALNAVGNFMQLLFTLLFGILSFGFFFSLNDFKLPIDFQTLSIGTGLLFICLVIFFATKNRLKESFNRFKILVLHRKTTLKVFLFSGIRYLIFSHQFYFILLFFNVELSYLQAINLIFLTYFLSSLVPVFTLFDFVIKGSVAVFLFSKFGVSEIQILSTTTLMWFLNFIIPAVIGVFYIVQLKKYQINLR